MHDLLLTETIIRYIFIPGKIQLAAFPRGATCATILDMNPDEPGTSALKIRPGNVVVFEEVMSPTTVVS